MRTARFAAIAAALILVAASEGVAQSTIGFKMGASFSNVSTNFDTDDSKTLTAFTGGGFIRFPLGPVQLQPELMYITKGFKMEESSEEGDVEAKFKLSYIEIPVLLMLQLMQGGSFSPYVIAGPAFAFEAGCKVAFSGGGFSGSVDCDDPEGDELQRKKFDVGAMAGLGASFPAGPGAVLIEGRYNFGLMNIADTEGDDELKHRSGAVLIGYSIPLSRR